MIRIEIGRRHFLLYLLLPHPLTSRLLTTASRANVDRINRSFNESIYSGTGASAYDEIHRYAQDEQHEDPARPLVDRVWPGAGGYGQALEAGAGRGYFTTLIARHARSVLAPEPVADMQAVLEARCRAEGMDNVEVLGTTYHAREFWSDERNWATHDFLTRGELRAPCRHGGFDRPRLSAFWIPYSRRFVLDAERRFGLEAGLGRWPVFRHWGSALALEARRRPPTRS